MNTFLLFLFTFSIIIPNQAATINNQDSLTKDSYVKVLWQDNILPDTKQASENTASPNAPNWLLISGLIGILGSALTWLYNEWQKRINRLRQEKEARYKKLISLIRSFGVGAFNHEKANEFIVEFQLCWMYCPDIIIEKGNYYIDLLSIDTDLTEQSERDIAKGELILEIRRDLIMTSKTFKFLYNRKKTTKLRAIDFKDVYC